MQKNFYKPVEYFLKKSTESDQTEMSNCSEEVTMQEEQQVEIPQLTEEEKKQKLRLQRIKNLEISRLKKKEKSSTPNLLVPQPVTKKISKQNDQVEPKEEQSIHKKREQNRIKHRWNSNCKIVTLSIPQRIPSTSSIKNRTYLIQFRYTDENGKMHEATIKFGSPDGKDYITSKSQQDKLRNQTRFSQINNPLDPNYWRFWICNTEDTVTKAYCEYLIRNSIY